MSFNKFGFQKTIIDAINDVGYTNPTKIQSEAIPIILENKDLLASSNTGTGKTAAFSLPIISKTIKLKKQQNQNKAENPYALIIAPTRELVQQIFDNFKLFGKKSFLRYTCVYGGINKKLQIKILKEGCDILIATPGRLLDLFNEKVIDLSKINTLVLDEADQMLDMGFLPDVKKIVSKLPRDRQTLLFSATLPTSIIKLAKSLLNNPIRIDATPEKISLDKIRQEVYFVDQKNKLQLLKIGS